MTKRPSTPDRDPSATESADDDQFLSRWARRKRLARAGGDPDDAAADPSEEKELLAKAAPPASAEGVPAGEDGQATDLTNEDMPPVDAIDENTDMSGFFSPKVTQAVKKAALRKFFHSPAFNIVDGLDDYDDDFRNFAALGDIITSDMRSQMDREAERAKQAVEDSAKEAGKSDVETAEVDEASEKVEGQDEADQQSEIAAADSDPEQPAADEPGVTRDPARPAAGGYGKLRPRDDGGKA